MSEIDLITDIIYNKLGNANSEKDFIIRSYSGKYASGGQKSIHYIFGGAKTIKNELRPLMNADGSQQLNADGKRIFENVPVKGMLGQGGGTSPVSLNTPISTYKPSGAGVGRYTPVQPTNRNTQFLTNLLRYNNNMKGLL